VKISIPTALKKYFKLVGLLANLFLFVGVTVLFVKVDSLGMSLPLFSEKVQADLSVNHPNLLEITSPILKAMTTFKASSSYFRQVDLNNWSGLGASINVTKNHLLGDIYATNTKELIKGLKEISAGQTLVITPGDYHVKQASISLVNDGLKGLPIKVTATLGTVKIFIRGEGFVIDKPYWQFSNLHIIGACEIHSQCEHAFHVVGNGQHALIENNIIQDFNAMIKVNGIGDNYPDNGRVIQNTLFNTVARKTANPVTPIDLMHANNWLVSKNFIFDIQKSSGDKISYAAFFKGGSEQGVFERNLIMCAANLPDEYTALGLSLGGGGSLKKDRRNQNSAEHIGGIIRNNIIMHCANDVGIYVNRSRDSFIEHNILYNTLGVDIRYPESDVKVTNNVISGRIKVRDNAQLIQRNNIIVNRGFITGKDNLSDYFIAPDIGNFTWKKVRNTNVQVNESSPIALDFCNAIPSQQYIGAYSTERFCLDKININNNVNTESVE
jgi:hypothetical protein